MGINAADLNAATNRNIMLGILDKGTTKNATAIRAGIAPNTFYRKLNSCGDFTLRELGQIADALDLSLQDMLKDAA
jgi:DNA-binding phage protein